MNYIALFGSTLTQKTYFLNDGSTSRVVFMFSEAAPRQYFFASEQDFVFTLFNDMPTSALPFEQGFAHA